MSIDEALAIPRTEIRVLIAGDGWCTARWYANGLKGGGGQLLIGQGEGATVSEAIKFALRDHRRRHSQDLDNGNRAEEKKG